MKALTLIILFFAFLVSGHICLSDTSTFKELRDNFSVPPDSARPGVYWYFMDGNISKEAMTKDLESMKNAGIGSVVFLEVNVGIPRGKVNFLSDEWKDCFRHAVKECQRLGISMILGIGPGWTGSGGPWVKASESMRHLVASVSYVEGSGLKTITLAKPSPKKPYFGEGVFTADLRAKWLEYYEDVAVLAFPSINENILIKDIDEKALYYRPPYSSAKNVKQFIPRQIQLKPLQDGDFIKKDNIIDLSKFLKGDSITWNVPPGKWTIMRFGVRNNGAITRPAPLPGLGFECDKADKSALESHLSAFTDILIKDLPKQLDNSTGGLKVLHMDSWEMGAQNWTPSFRDEFKKRRGYDPQPYYPIYAGFAVEDINISERFLWDLRQTMQELILENHSMAVKDYAHKYGMQLSIEPYDMTPMQDLELGATADIPMCEFWSPGGFNTSFSAIEGSSLANIKGQRIVPSEAFTAINDAWRQHPASMKNQTDWAFAAGINRLTFHTFQHQPLPDSLRPGMTMGPFGVHWDRNQTWWPYVSAYHRYVSRCQYLLQKGRTIADILYLAPEEAPFVFRAPKSALAGDFMPDKRGYNFDACPPSLLYSAFVSNGKIKFPSGMEYEILILPNFKTMTLRMLKKIESLVKDGATVVGLPPEQTPGLSDYPKSDEKLKIMVKNLWGSSEAPEGLVFRKYGAGSIVWGSDVKNSIENLYPNFDISAKILMQKSVPFDFSSDKNSLRYIHKQYKNLDYFFVSNRTDSNVEDICRFRMVGKEPYLWNPINGKISKLKTFDCGKVHTSIKLSFAPFQSYFIVFADSLEGLSLPILNEAKTHLAETLDGAWSVYFNPECGGMGYVEFSELRDWSKDERNEIKYYSGIAVYTKHFKFDGDISESLFLDLGRVKNIAKVYLNGKDLGIVWTYPWRLDISSAIKKGDNELKIEVANLWANRLIGDSFGKAEVRAGLECPESILKGKKTAIGAHSFATFKHYKQNSKLLESGLLGPVKIIREPIGQ